MNSNLTPMQEVIAKTEQAMQTAKLFVIKYESKIPEGLGHLTIDNNQTIFMISLEYVEEDDRNRALTALGDIFGRVGWEATLDYNGKYFTWKKTLDGVKLRILGAQKSGVPDSFPVDPKQFPLQLL